MKIYNSYICNYLKIPMNTTAPTFSKQDNLKFFRTLNSRVNSYFKENNIQKTGNWKLHLKTIILFTVFLAPYFIILTLDLPFWAYLLLTIVIGIGMAGVGMNVMHDGNLGQQIYGRFYLHPSRKCIQLASATQCFTSHLH